MTWPMWVLVICVAVSFACVIFGVVRAALIGRAVNARVARIKASPVFSEAEKLNGYALRINNDLAQMDSLLVRAQAALLRIREGVQDLRIPEAVIALRAAGAAIRLFASGR